MLLEMVREDLDKVTDLGVRYETLNFATFT
jgi:hypothetical protein